MLSKIYELEDKVKTEEEKREEIEKMEKKQEEDLKVYQAQLAKRETAVEKKLQVKFE
jgi:hypothetical protein